MAQKEESPTEIGLGDFVLPDKKKVGKILLGLSGEVQKQEETDLILGPFFDIMDQVNGGSK